MNASTKYCIAILVCSLVQGTFAEEPPLGGGQKSASGSSGTSGETDSPIHRTHDLPALIRAAKPEFQPVTQPQVERARDSLSKAVSNLTSFLDRKGVAGEGWKHYLRLAQLEQELVDGDASDPVRLRQLYEPFVGDHAGLEIDQITSVRRRLQEYFERLEDYGNPHLQQDSVKQLEQLATAIERYCEDPRSETLARVADPLGWLERRGQADSIVLAVRRQLSRPNLRLLVSGDILSAAVAAQINQSEPVRDIVLGTPTRGTGRTVGMVAASLVPDDKIASIHVELKGTNTSQTVGYDDPIRIHQNNRTEFRSWKQVTFGRNGVQLLPAESEVSVDSELTGLTTTLRHALIERPVRRRALRKYHSQKQKADRVVESLQRQRINQRLDEMVAARLNENSQRFNEGFLWPLVRHDVFPRQFDTRSTRDQLLLTLQFCNTSQIGAPRDPPPSVAGADLAVQFHESTFNNLASDFLGGRALTVEDLIQLPGSTAILNGGDEVDAEETVTVTLDETAPLSLQIDDDVVSLTMRGQRYVIRNRSYPPMNVTIHYRVERIDDGVRATRIGVGEIVAPEIAAGERARYSMREKVFQRLLATRLEQQWPQQYMLDGVTFEGVLSVLGKLGIVQLVADDGWLVIACRRPADEQSRAPD